MKKFTAKIYEIEEAFFNTLLFMSDKEEAKNAFAEMLDSDDVKYNFMVDYLATHNEFYSMVSDEVRKTLELDAGAYYVEHD